MEWFGWTRQVQQSELIFFFSLSSAVLHLLFSLCFKKLKCADHLSPSSVYPCLPLITCFPALATGYMFSRACYWLHVFPRFSLVTCFIALAIGYTFSRACYWLRAFPRLPLVSRFPALTAGYVSPRLLVIPCFPAVAIDCFPLLPVW